MADESSLRLSEQTDPGAIEYRSISVLAILALLFGLASVAAFVGVLLWLVPLLGIITGSIAITRIERSAGALAGRGAALCGLALALLFGTAAVTRFFATQRVLASRAERLALEWFAALAHDEPHLAHQLTLPAMQRLRVSDSQQLWNYYRAGADHRRDLERFVAEPLVRTLLALDGRCTVRLHATQGISMDDTRTQIAQTYSVTYEENGSRKTFFVNLTLERSQQRSADRVDWRISSYSGGGKPL